MDSQNWHAAYSAPVMRCLQMSGRAIVAIRSDRSGGRPRASRIRQRAPNHEMGVTSGPALSLDEVLRGSAPDVQNLLGPLARRRNSPRDFRGV
eukprot:4760480-Pyramimonas_sp.AAC.1